MRKRRLRISAKVVMFILVILLGVGVYLAFRYNLIPKKKYTAADFNIEVIRSSVDYDNDGVG